MPGGWSSAVRAGVVSVVSISAIGIGSIVLAAFQGHALVSDVTVYETLNNARVKALEEKFTAQLKRFEDERVLQAAFRGAVSVRLRLDLGQVQEPDDDKIGG